MPSTSSIHLNYTHFTQPAYSLDKKIRAASTNILLIAETQWKGQACFYSSRKQPDLNLFRAAPSSHWKIPTENWYDSLYEKKHHKRVIIEIKQKEKKGREKKFTCKSKSSSWKRRHHNIYK